MVKTTVKMMANQFKEHVVHQEIFSFGSEDNRIIC
jgi:hypothetical protein